MMKRAGSEAKKATGGEVIPLEQHPIGDLRTGKHEHDEVDFGQAQAENSGSYITLRNMISADQY